MKRLVALFSFTALIAGAFTAYAGMPPATGVNGSWHDITYLGQNGTTYNQDEYQRVCIFCHTPHNAMQTLQPAPLWNHEITQENPTPYVWAAPANSGITFNADRLIGPSRLCESCHDGSLAVDAHGGAGQQNNGTTQMSGPRMVNDLTITHPIGFSYAQAYTLRGASQIYDVIGANTTFATDVQLSNTAGVYNTIIRGTEKIVDHLYQSTWMTCATCHDVHNTNNAVSSPGVTTGNVPNYFVWAKEDKSLLCLSCHIK